ncbi:hypothetical protein H7H78_00540 [Mycobacterium shinjukuense]|nr:colicin immunity domain-containing protein [Mycobacterium shinjukuense]MCV6983994.1 hypothetical protein [Mycobacterium shinjukuense]ORB63328.1 hypothetical protein BST45_17755 [Mycobacterium shinjukuense]
MTAKYRELISSFINREISAQHFESSYLALFKHGKDQFPGPEFNVLEGLFFDVDDYVADPELRRDVHGLDDEELRACAREAYRKLYET